MFKSIIKSIFLLTVLVLTTGFGNLPLPATSMGRGEFVLPPYGLVDLCKRQPELCKIRDKRSILPRLTEENWLKIIEINAQVNATIRQREDVDIFGEIEVWSLPVRLGELIVGDCEDISLDKRRRLIDAGFPEKSLVFAVARLPSGILHTMLIVRTDKGDYALDNLEDGVLPWQKKVGYEWIARQNENSMLYWNSL